MKILSLTAVSLAASVALLAQIAPPKTHLKVGDMAPELTLRSTEGKTVKLSDFRGKQAVVLAFYPAAFTGGCTKEMLAYQASLGKFQGNDAQVFGVSTDNSPSQKEFAAKLNVTFPMLSDFAKREASAAYGTLNAATGTANRATFVIDKDGKIIHIEEGTIAVDITGAELACSRLKKKT